MRVAENLTAFTDNQTAAPLVPGQQLKNRTEGNLSDENVPNADTADAKRAQCLVLLRDVTAQRDKLLAQYEAMALQVDESVREIDEDIFQLRHYAKQAEASERHAADETARANDLARKLDEERRMSAGISDEFARFRLTAEQRYAAAERALALQPPPDETPRAMLWRAITLIACDAVAWTRAKIPPDSPLLPWFDRAIDVATKAGRLAWKYACAFIEWATPRVIDLWKWAKSEVAKRVSKG
jgi:hypothetical protein